jgi:deazaflavin-dependent oxidoreductase (nitroreductase family)
MVVAGHTEPARARDLWIGGGWNSAGHRSRALGVDVEAGRRRRSLAEWNTAVIDEFRSHEGRVAAFARQPLLLLTHRGARSGASRTNPLAYFRDGDDFVIVASKGGAPTNPDWYHNLLANPDAAIEVGTEELRVTARAATQEERSRLWAMITTANPVFAQYEEKTPRTIPVMILTPAR